MDKNTLSHYGWIIVMLIIIALLLGAAYPFAMFTKDAFFNTATALGDKIDIPGPSVPPSPDDYKDYEEDNVDPKSQVGRNVINDSRDFWQYELSSEIQHATKMTFQKTLGKFKSYGQIYYYNTLPKDFVFENVVMSYRESPVSMTSEMFSEILSYAEEENYEYTDAEDLFLWYLECETKDDFEAFAKEGGYESADAIMIDTFGMTYDGFIVAFENHITNSLLPNYMDEEEAKNAISAAFKEGKIALDITDDEVNRNVLDEKDAGRVIMYIEGTDLIIAGKNGKVISDESMKFLTVPKFDVLSSINFNNALNTKSVTSTSSIFAYKTNLSSINFAGVDFSNVDTASGMFGYTSFANIDLSMLNFDSLLSADRMFTYAKSLEKVILPLNGLPSATSTWEMFSHCESLTTVKNLKIPVARNLAHMFYGCTSYAADEPLDLSFLPSTATSVDYMFYGCTQIKEVKMDNITLNEIIDMQNFLPHGVIEKISMKNFTAPKIKGYNYMPYFMHYGTLKELDISGLTSPLEHFAISHPQYGSVLEHFVANDLNLPNLTNMDYFIYGANIETLSLSFVSSTSSIESAQFAFSGCDSLKSLDLTHIDFSNATNVWRIVSGNDNLETLVLGDFNSATDIGEALYYLPSLVSLKVGDMSKTSEISFYHSPKLKYLELGPVNPDADYNVTIFPDKLVGIELKYNDTIANFKNSVIYKASKPNTFSSITCVDGTL